MLNGSVFLRVALLVVAAAALTGLGRYYFSHDGGLPETPLPTAPEKAPPAPKTEPAPAPKVEAPAPPPAQAAPPAPSQAPASAPGPTAMFTPQPAPEPTMRETPAAPEAQRPPSAAPAEPPRETAEANADAPAIDLVDLNTASLAQLNGLKGGGAIGRAIVQHRPYASVDQLLSKRVLSRTTYQRIKDQVTVR